MKYIEVFCSYTNTSV